MKQMNVYHAGFTLASLALIFFSACSKEEKPPSAPVPSTNAVSSKNVSPVASPPTNEPAAPESKTNSVPGISGKIILKGTPPPEKNIAMDATCGALHQLPLKTRLYVVGEDGALADVFVYVKEGLAGKKFPAPDKSVLLDQSGCEYVPYVVGVQTNQKLLVRNSDPVMHNVHPMPMVTGNKEENKAQMPKAPDLPFAFAHPEQFLKFSCQVHPWMVAYVCVVEHPFFAVTTKDGTFTLKNLPAGKYVIEAVHRKAGRQTKEITLAAGETTSLDFTFEVPGAQ